MLGIMTDNEQTGLYSGAFRLINLTLVPAGLIITVFFPSLSVAWQDKNRSIEHSKLFARSLLVFGTPLVVFFGLCAEPILRLVYGEEFVGAAAATMWLSIGMLIIYTGVVFCSPLAAWNKERYMMKVTILGALTNVLINLLLIPRFGILGAAWASCASQTLVTVGFAIGFFNNIGLLHVSIFARVALCLAIAGTAAHFAEMDFGSSIVRLVFAVIIQGTVFAITYGLVAVLIFRDQVRQLLKRPN